MSRRTIELPPTRSGVAMLADVDPATIAAGELLVALSVRGAVDVVRVRTGVVDEDGCEPVEVPVVDGVAVFGARRTALAFAPEDLWRVVEMAS